MRNYLKKSILIGFSSKIYENLGWGFCISPITLGWIDPKNWFEHEKSQIEPLGLPIVFPKKSRGFGENSKKPRRGVKLTPLVFPGLNPREGSNWPPLLFSGLKLVYNISISGTHTTDLIKFWWKDKIRSNVLYIGCYVASIQTQQQTSSYGLCQRISPKCLICTTRKTPGLGWLLYC